MRRLLIVINAFLFIFLCIEIIAIANALTTTPQAKKNTPETNKTITQQSPSPKQKITVGSLDAPQFLSLLKWKDVDTNDKGSLYQDIKDSVLYYNLDTPISIPGKELVATVNQKDTFETEYDTQLTKDGWSQSNKYNGHPLSTIAADGPTGSIWGYTKIVDGSLRAIIISRNSISKTTGKVTTECPCSYEYRIFVSDIIPTSKITTKN